MIKSIPHSEFAPSPHAIDRFIEEYGAWKVLAAAFASLLRRASRNRRILAEDISEHIRRDIGLPTR